MQIGYINAVHISVQITYVRRKNDLAIIPLIVPFSALI